MRLGHLPVAAPAVVMAILLAGLAPGASALAQAIDLSHGGAVNVTARDGIDLDQNAQTVTARGQARAVRGDVTVDADVLIAHYRKKAGGAALGATQAAAQIPATPAPATQASTTASTHSAAGAPAAKPATEKPATEKSGTATDDTGNNEIYRLEASGHVHIYTPTDNAIGDHAIYDIDQAVMVMTGAAMKITTPQDTMTARDSMEYWSQLHRSVGRGDATVTTNDARRVRADVLVGYSASDKPPTGKSQPDAAPAKPEKNKAGSGGDTMQSAGKLERVEAYGNVVIQTQTEIVKGDRGVYVPDVGIARIIGNVHVTRGLNQLNGAAAIVNMKTGLATMTEAPNQRVQGLVVPNDAQPSGQGASARPGKQSAPAGTVQN